MFLSLSAKNLHAEAYISVSDNITVYLPKTYTLGVKLITNKQQKVDDEFTILFFKIVMSPPKKNCMKSHVIADIFTKT